MFEFFFSELRVAPWIFQEPPQQPVPIASTPGPSIGAEDPRPAPVDQPPNNNNNPRPEEVSEPKCLFGYVARLLLE